MMLPDFLEGRASEIITAEENTAFLAQDTAYRKKHWAVILGLQPGRKGDEWCFMWGESMTTAVVAYGKSPYQAMVNFDKEMEKSASGVENATIQGN